MNITLDCLPCFVRHTLEVLKEFSQDEELKERVLRKVLCRMSELEFQQTPPEFAGEVHSFIRQELNCEDPYREIKRNSNLLAEKLVNRLEDRVTAADNPLRTAVLYAIAGNIIDSGVSAVTSIDEILNSIEMAEKETPEIDDFSAMEKAIAKAKNVLYLGDNAGEIYFDRLLLNILHRNKKITYAVKTGPVLNDATIEDAMAAGIDQYARVIGNGTQIPGTPLSRVSEEFMEAYKNADIIISKGQANFETLSGEPDDRIFFLLRAKCSVIARKAQVKHGCFLILRNGKKII